MESAPRFFAKKVPELHNTEEVSDAVEKHTRLTGEKVPNTPEAKLGVYMGRLESIFLNEDEETRKRNIEMLRENIHDAFVIKREEVPESYFELQQRIARERGQAVETIPERVREQMKDVIIEDQTKSLDDWVNYLTSNDAMYPTWFKYLAFRNIVKLSQFDKELGKFKERTKSTTAPFPDIYREALAQLCDVYEKAAGGDKEALKNPAFQEFVAKKFPTQYAEFVLKNLEQSQENKEEIRGQWVKYEQGDMEGAKRLYESLQGKGTGWCTAGESTARHQIEDGDFYVYYTNDTDGDPTQPRLAIRMDGMGMIGEIRGILPHQEVEPILQDILDEKLTEFGSEAEVYRKKSMDMRYLTALERKVEQNEALTEEDLIFLYEINSPIQGFGYEEDPRIESVRSKRSMADDFESIFSVLSGDPIEVGKRMAQAAYDPKKLIEMLRGIPSALSVKIGEKEEETDLLYKNSNALDDHEFEDREFALQEEIGDIWNRYNILSQKIERIVISMCETIVEQRFHEDVPTLTIPDSWLHKTQVEKLSYFLSELKGTDITERLITLIELGYGTIVSDNYKKYMAGSVIINGSRLAQALMNEGVILPKELKVSSDTISQETINNFIRDKKVENLVQILPQYPGILDAGVATFLIRNKHGREFLNFIDKFDLLDEAVAGWFINNHYFSQLGKNIKRFDHRVHSKVAMAIIQSGTIMPLINNLENFRELDQSIAEILSTRYKYEALVSQNPQSFSKP